MYTDIYDYPTSYSRGFAGVDSTWMIISLVLAIVGGIFAYFAFVAKKNPFKGPFIEWLHDFLNFKMYIVSGILKIAYVCTAIFITLGSFGVIGSSVASFFGILIFGNLIARISYEMLLMMITLVNNTSEINRKLGSKETKKEETKEKKNKEEK